MVEVRDFFRPEQRGSLKSGAQQRYLEIRPA